MRGLALLGEYLHVREEELCPLIRVLGRYCFGGAMAGRLGSTGLVNTIVIAHPSNLKPAQVRAIQVTDL
jgi:hypothetical protein